MLQTVQRETSALLRPSTLQVAKFDGELVSERIGNKSELAKLYSKNPIRFMPLARSVTSLPGSAAMDIKYVTTAQFGPGIGGANPERSIRIHVKERSAICLTLASSTKIFKSRSGRPCSNIIEAKVDDMGFLMYAPEPLLVSKSTSASQLQTFELKQNASVAVLEWLSNAHRGQDADSVWNFDRFESTMTLKRDGAVFSERIALDNTDHCLDERMGINEKDRFQVVGRFVLYGPQCQESVQKLLNMADRLDTMQLTYHNETEISGFSVKNCDPKHIQGHDVFFALRPFDENRGCVLYFGGLNKEPILKELIAVMDPLLSALLL